MVGGKEIKMKNKTEEKKKFSPFKKLMILLIVILLIFGIWNLSWYVLKFRPYQKLAEKLDLINVGGGDDDELQRYFLEKDGYSFTVAMPSYLGFEGGFCRISTYNNYENYVDLEEESNEETKEDSKEVTGYSFYYYPRIFEDDQYALFVEMGEGESFEFFPIYVTENLEYLNMPELEKSEAEIEEDKKMLKENHEALEKLMEQKIEMWG